MAEYRDRYRLAVVPPPAKVIDELLTDFLGCRLTYAPLSLDIFAQTEWTADETIVTVNSRTDAIGGVKDAKGVQNVAKWHEAVHVTDDAPKADAAQGVLAGFESDKRVICRRGEQIDHSAAASAREFRAEEAGRAAAVSYRHLRESEAFRRLARNARTLTNGSAWGRLYQAADDIFVNISALVTQLELEGLIVIEKISGKTILRVQPSLDGFLETGR